MALYGDYDNLGIGFGSKPKKGKREPSLEESIEDISNLWEKRFKKVEKGSKKAYKGYKKVSLKLKGFFKRGKGPLYD